MKKIKELVLTGCKGIAIGISMIIPGFSGGTIALLMNIYDKILEAVTGVFNHFKKSMYVLIPLLIGAVIGFVGLVKPLGFGLNNFPLVTVSLFVGFIIGGVPFLYKKVKGKENVISIIVGLLAMGLTISLCFIKSNLYINLSEGINVGLFFYLFLAGLLASIALVAPGISGSMTLMLLGIYAPLISVLEELMTFTNLGNNLLVLLPIFLGIVIGFFLMSILMKYLLKKHTTSTYFAIIGFVLGSIVTIYYSTITDEEITVVFDALNIILSIVVLILGAAGAFFVEHIANKKSNDAIESENQEINKEE